MRPDEAGDGTEGHDTTLRASRSGDAGWGHERDREPRTRGRGVPGKRATTTDLGDRDPASRMLASLQIAWGQIAAVRERHLPRMRATLDARTMHDARMAATELGRALGLIDRQITEARELATALGNDGAIAQLETLSAERDAVRAEAEPALALAPPPAPVPELAAFSLHLDAVDRVAAEGVSGAGASLPHLDAIQRAFGKHDVSGVAAHVGGKAAGAAKAIGAEAYATGNHVAFASAPDLHTAAHEAAHVVQHGRGVHFLGGMGLEDRPAEAHADAVADRVVAGASAEQLLDVAPASHGTHRKAAGADTDASMTSGLALDSSTVDFGAAIVGEAQIRNVGLSNRGDRSELLKRTTLADGDFTAHVMGAAELAPGAETSIMVVFGPSRAGQHRQLLPLVTADDVGLNLLVTGVATVRRAIPAGPEQEPEDQVSRPSSAIEPDPPSLEFGEDVKGDVSSLIMLWNHGEAAVSIDSVDVKDGGRAFLAELVGSETVAPGEATQLAIEFRPAFYAAETAEVRVASSDGSVVHIPITGPTVSGLASTESDVLEVHPADVDFGPVRVGLSASRVVSVLNRGLTPVSVDELAGRSGVGKQFEGSIRGDAREVPGGGTLRVEIVYAPTEVGPIADTLWLTGELRQVVWAGIYVSGEGSSDQFVAAPVNDQVDEVQVTAPAECAEDDAETRANRRLAEQAINAWDKTIRMALVESTDTLRGEWLDYLSLTAANPTISPVTLPDASFLRGLISNSFGNAINDKVIGTEDRVAAAAAPVVAKLVSEIADDVISEEALARVAKIVGKTLGFALGVLIETAAGMIFDWLVPDDSSEDAVQDAYDQGRVDGAAELGAQLAAKEKQLVASRTAALRRHDREEEQQRALASSSCSAAELAQQAASLDDVAVVAAQARPADRALSHGLLALWVRDHARSTRQAGDDVLKQQWKSATTSLARIDPDHFQPGRIQDLPDLFRSQCIHEWASRHLEVPAELQGRIADEIGASEEELADPQNAEQLAARCVARFDGREFVWTPASGGFLSLENVPREVRFSDWHRVSCRPTLAVVDGSCIVTRFSYRLVGAGRQDSAMTSAPGDRTLSYESIGEAAAPTPHAVGNRLYAYMQKLQGAGAIVERELDAGENDWLKRTFGEEVAIPQVQHADGRPEPVTVFRLRGSANAEGDGSGCDAEGLDDLGEQRREDGYRMIRGGNTILVIEPCVAP